MGSEPTLSDKSLNSRLVSDGLQSSVLWTLQMLQYRSSFHILSFDTAITTLGNQLENKPRTKLQLLCLQQEKVSNIITCSACYLQINEVRPQDQALSERSRSPSHPWHRQETIKTTRTGKWKKLQGRHTGNQTAPPHRDRGSLRESYDRPLKCRGEAG